MTENPEGSVEIEKEVLSNVERYPKPGRRFRSPVPVWSIAPQRGAWCVRPGHVDSVTKGTVWVEMDDRRRTIHDVDDPALLKNADVLKIAGSEVTQERWKETFIEKFAGAEQAVEVILQQIKAAADGMRRHRNS